MFMLWNRIIYLAISILITVFVARTLHKHGRPFLIDVFGGNERIADAMNRLLVVGFYLVNIGLALWSVRYGDVAMNLRASIEHLSTKIGWVLLILGGMHIFNVVVLSAIRRRKLAEPREIVDFLES